jgi:hypothetical protein
MPINEQDNKKQRQPEHQTGNGFERHKAVDQFVCVFGGVPAHKHRDCIANELANNVEISLP